MGHLKQPHWPHQQGPSPTATAEMRYGWGWGSGLEPCGHHSLLALAPVLSGCHSLLGCYPNLAMGPTDVRLRPRRATYRLFGQCMGRSNDALTCPENPMQHKTPSAWVNAWAQKPNVMGFAT